MTPLEYLTDAPYKCAMDDVNVMDFEEAAVIIRGTTQLKNFSPAASGRSAIARSLKLRRKNLPC
jgi:hypothetical protein